MRGPLFFEWDSRKAATNLTKHGVGFEEAQSTFADSLGLDLFDSAHSGAEDRWLRLGTSQRGRLIVVVYTERALTRGRSIRIVSARKATKTERLQYLRT